MLFLVLLAVASARPIVDLGIIRSINAPDSGALWTAGVNEKFIGVDLSQAHEYCGVRPPPPDEPISTKPNPVVDIRDLPTEYDASEAHPGCIIDIRDQKSCGSCWAFGASETLSDRFNIAHDFCTPAKQIILSPQDLVSCDKQQQGCNGGWPNKAWNYTTTVGLTLDECDPYTSGGGQTGTCKITKPGAKCPSGKGKQVYYHSQSEYAVRGEQKMMEEIYEHGPIEVVFEVYNDFFNYKTGVYHHVSGQLAGYHAVKMIGWGVDKKSSQPYWIVYNSWGKSWGQKGLFWILKGKNECKIETPQYDSLENCAGLPGDITVA